MDRRVDVCPSDIKWLVLDKMMQVGEGIYAAIRDQREKAKVESVVENTKIVRRRKLRERDPWDK